MRVKCSSMLKTSLSLSSNSFSLLLVRLLLEGYENNGAVVGLPKLTEVEVVVGVGFVVIMGNVL